MVLPSQAGWVERDSHGGIMYISRGMIKVVPDARGEVWTIMDMNKHTIKIINPKNRSYTEFNPNEFCLRVKTMMLNMISEMPPERRAVMQQMIGQSSTRRAPLVQVENKGSGGTLRGLNTTKYAIKVNGRPYKDVWIAPNAPIMKDVRGFVRQANSMSAKMESCSQFGPAARGPSPEVSREYTALSEKGWPMRELNRRTNRVEKEVLSLTKKNIPASFFHVPAGYTRVDMKNMMGGMRR